MKLFRTLVLAAMFVVFGADAMAAAPGDVVVERTTTGTQSYQPATFPHWKHAIRYRCYVCHPAIFKMVKFKTQKGTLKQDRLPFVPEVAAKTGSKETDAKSANKEEEEKKTGKDGKAAAADALEANRMHGEQACGMCHNGKRAFNVEFKTCGRCHLKD